MLHGRRHVNLCGWEPDLNNLVDSASPAWVASLAEVSLAIGSPTFGEALLRAANVLVPIDNCTVFSFHRKAPSGCLLSVGRDSRLAVRLAEDYLAGGYVDDPNVRYIEVGAPSQVILRYSLDGLPDEFRRHFIEQAHIVDVVGCIASKGQRAVYCNFYRLAPSATYDERERAALGRILPILANLTAVHYTLCGPFLLHEQLTRLRTPEDEVRLLAERLGPSALDRLTEREREVCFRILLGYSSEAIGLHLGVATSTIITYRKRAYEKLGIVSQNELFSLYLHSLPGFGA